MLTKLVSLTQNQSGSTRSQECLCQQTKLYQCRKFGQKLLGLSLMKSPNMFHELMLATSNKVFKQPTRLQEKYVSLKDQDLEKAHRDDAQDNGDSKLLMKSTLCDVFSKTLQNVRRGKGRV